MQRAFLTIFAGVMFVSSVAYGQSTGVQPTSTPSSVRQSGGKSLGEIARELKEKQDSQGKPAPAKVITNQDLGEGPDGRPDLRVAPRPASFDRGNGQQPGQQRTEDQRAELLRSRILEQKERVASLQARMDQISSSLHSGVQMEYNRNRSMQAERVALMQTRLDEEKRKLNAMQEAARRAGMHTQVIDP